MDTKDVKLLKQRAETTILEVLNDFEKQTGMYVNDVKALPFFHDSGDRKIGKVTIEVLL